MTANDGMNQTFLDENQLQLDIQRQLCREFTVLEDDEEEIIVLLYGETPENRPPICKRKKLNDMEEENHEVTESQTLCVFNYCYCLKKE